MMKKYLLLLSVPFILTGCFNEEPDVVAPTEEDAAVEEPAQENEVNNEDAENSEDNSNDEASEEDNESSKNTDDDNSNSVAQTSSDSDDSDDSESNNQSTSNSENSNSGSTSQIVSESDEQEAIDAVDEYADFDQSNLIYLTHLEDNGEWIQVEVREGMEGQSQTSLIGLYRRHIETGYLEEFNFLEDGYFPVDEGNYSSENQGE